MVLILHFLLLSRRRLWLCARKSNLSSFISCILAGISSSCISSLAMYSCCLPLNFFYFSAMCHWVRSHWNKKLLGNWCLPPRKLVIGLSFSLMVKLTGWRRILWQKTRLQSFYLLIPHFGWPLHKLFMKDASLHGDLQEEIYMKQPTKFKAQEVSSELVCWLKKLFHELV